MSNLYKEAIEYLYNLEKFGISLGLHKIQNLLKPFNNPQDKIKVIHIAGTNGKGSTAAIIEAILSEHGYSVGLYTSPHLVKFNERIRISKKEIKDNEIVEYVNRLKPISDKINLKDAVTFFDFTTALAYLYFFDKKVDFAIMETGLGGRLDSTNIVKNPLISIITNISKEHEEFLGNTLKEIAKEKAGIIKKNGILVTGERKKEVLKVFEHECKIKNSKFFPIDKYVDIKIKNNKFDYYSGKFDFRNLECNLLGRHQLYNASLAIFSLEKAGIALDFAKVKKALKSVKWEGRLEKVMNKPAFIIDGAHNPAGAKILKDNLKLFEFKSLTLIISVMNDKDIDGLFKNLLTVANKVIFTKAKIERAANLDVLEEKAKKFINNIYLSETIDSAIKKSIDLSNEDDLIIFTGSLYAVGEAKEFFGKKKGNFNMGNKYK